MKQRDWFRSWPRLGAAGTCGYLAARLWWSAACGSCWSWRTCSGGCSACLGLRWCRWGGLPLNSLLPSSLQTGEDRNQQWLTRIWTVVSFNQCTYCFLWLDRTQGYFDFPVLIQGQLQHSAPSAFPDDTSDLGRKIQIFLWWRAQLSYSSN